ncbi:lactoylglutathione lyase [Paraburkholderia sp. Tr-20389]|uniref:VOC family protein n=1 Tax=Paraburkholderia sp. Tr-20389 TaxID=2703903 RepID=UPI0019805AFB|nr:VOC family protein [Paraburkholderia sp. Tr-20389]MBN3756023.1 lactoylglutathione lyase [Paraburkholderia sp. Tr-20389]
MKDLGIFRQLHDVCIVVRDIEDAVKFYESTGVGPWKDFPPMDAYELNGYNREAFLQLRYKFATCDNVQIQLCQPGQGDTPQRRFLGTCGEGVFHLGFMVDDVDAAQQQGVDAGLPLLGSGRLDDRSGFTYFNTAEKGAGVTLVVRKASAQANKGIKA